MTDKHPQNEHSVHRMNILCWSVPKIRWVRSTSAKSRGWNQMLRPNLDQSQKLRLNLTSWTHEGWFHLSPDVWPNFGLRLNILLLVHLYQCKSQNPKSYWNLEDFSGIFVMVHATENLTIPHFSEGLHPWPHGINEWNYPFTYNLLVERTKYSVAKRRLTSCTHIWAVILNQRVARTMYTRTGKYVAHMVLSVSFIHHNVRECPQLWCIQPYLLQQFQSRLASNAHAITKQYNDVTVMPLETAATSTPTLNNHNIIYNHSSSMDNV